ncbi:GNAT family N-acetyltransferase [Rhizobium rhizosphaerae]|uniref:GNAT family N-acetyltransferase n=1 Tax=Xaviernesmea rhizosphaerae TaxID=1672749 RepID=A0ABX3PJN1_9HYPH|nr:GNAT family N-acetyltransferase [Xaviernesmea rhizosphaerae]OQP88455.1 GNAT family N-acetyltransferase [Xaviernesmea rhizosphaerae]
MDMLVKLYELTPDPALDRRMADEGIIIRRALAPELKPLTDWILPRFGAGWVGEATIALARQPVSCFIAVKDGALVGFACHEATAKGFFGPTGVDESCRGKGVGQALLLRTLLDMRDQGYAYGVIGGAGPTGFYQRTVGAVAIEGSVPGIYRGMLQTAAPSGVDGNTK